MTDATRQILLHLDDGGWHSLAPRFSRQQIVVAKTKGLIWQVDYGQIIGARFRLTQLGHDALGAGE